MWEEFSGLLQLQPSYCVEEAWLFQLGEATRCGSDVDGLLIFGGPGFRPIGVRNANVIEAASWDDGVVLSSRDPGPAAEIDFSAPDSAL